MVDLAEFCGDNALRASLVCKRQRVRDRLMKITEEKVVPLTAEIECFTKMIAAIDEKDAAATVAQENTQAASAEL